MGSYAECWLDDLLVGSSKNDIDTEIISLFRPNDKVLSASFSGHVSKLLVHYQETVGNDSGSNYVYYEAQVEIVRDRLNILGYDLSTAKEAFRAWVSEELKKSIEFYENCFEKDIEYKEAIEIRYRAQCEALSSLTPENWIENLKVIQSKGLESNYYSRYKGPYEGTTIGYMLSNEWYGYPGYDLFVPLRLAIESIENSKFLVYDLTDLVWSGYFDEDEDFVEYGFNVSASEYSSKAKTIVLTEGKTDAWVLSEAFDLLYPHLREYFSFLDFESTGYGGGVGNLANVVKAFAGAGIVNHVIALFDNDTAAASACRALEKVSFPPNIAICRLPELRLLKSYPTVGPSGSVDLDVNGMAASIELYFGDDVLRLDDGNLVPIQWTGYDKAARKYQGEVLEKAFLHCRFKDKLARARRGEKLNWEDLDAVFQLLFNTFVEKNRKSICKRASEYYAR